MNAVVVNQLDEFLRKAKIKAAEPNLGIGRELTYLRPPLRTVVVHFGRSDQPSYISKVLSIVLSLEKTWLLIPRYGAASKLALIEGSPDVAAVSFGPSEREKLATFLRERPKGVGSISSDLYVVSATGNILVTWDHHTLDEGLSVKLRQVKESSRLLALLNDLGTELEVFYSAG